MKKNGLTIIECLIFLTIIIMILVALNKLQIMTFMVKTTERNHRNINLQAFSVLDIIAKDCMQAHSLYLNTSDNGIVLLNIPTHEGVVDVGYNVKNNNLRRITGIFNRNTKKWQGKKVSTLFTHVLSFTIKQLPSASGIHVKIVFNVNDKEYWLERDIMMRNRFV